MRMIEGLLAELEQEAQATRRVLERVPEAHLAWKPHPKSMSLGQLALHVATVPGNVAELAAGPGLDEPPAFVQEPARTTAELLPALDDSISRARVALGSFADAAMAATWRLTVAGKEVMAVPRAGFVRAVMLNHWYHHRGQLLVYLRLLDVPVPSVYGPSADENPFAAPAEPVKP
ncbi:MAG: DinB family protein [Vicinamibacterales bacterium]